MSLIVKQQMYSSQSLDSLQAPEEYIPNEQRLASDLQEREYDSNVLRCLLFKDKEQQKKEQDMTKQSKKQKNDLRKILQDTFQQFQRQVKSNFDPENAEIIWSNMLTIKLQAHKFMEIAVLNFDQNQDLFSFYAQCATNMAYKLNIYCVVDCLEDYHKRQPYLQTKYQMSALEFEHQINRCLNWNLQFTTASEFIHFFIDNHFSDSYNSTFRENIEEICDRIILAYLEYKWSSISIALGCLAYLFQEDDEQSDYLQYIIQHYQKEFSQFEYIIDLDQVLQVRDYLISNDQEDEEEEELEEERQLKEQLTLQENNLQSCDSDNDLYYKRLSSSSSQTQNYDLEEFPSTSNAESLIQTQQISYNKKRSSTQYALQQCNKSLYDEESQQMTTKSRCYSQQINFNQNPRDKFDTKNGEELRKKFKSSQDC